MTSATTITRYESGRPLAPRRDDVAVEEPLEIRVEGAPVAVAMRTPGHDRELAAGWLLSEGIVRGAGDIAEIAERPGGDPARGAMVDVMLKNPAAFDVRRHRRNILTNASCGLCGAASVEQALRELPAVESDFRVRARILHALPAALRAHQPGFDLTGGLHACALFDENGGLLAVREDADRHNALDKLCGRALLDGRLPLDRAVLLLSGRVSFEMVQKALAAGIPVLAAIGAPSSLAVDLATRAGMTLAAFVREGTFNLYCGAQRIVAELHGASGP